MKMNANSGHAMYLLIAPTPWAAFIVHVLPVMMAMVSLVTVSIVMLPNRSLLMKLAGYTSVYWEYVPYIWVKIDECPCYC